MITPTQTDKGEDILLDEIPPTPGELIGLYATASWGDRDEYDRDAMARVIERSRFITARVAGEEGRKVVGFARVLTDKTLTTWIAEIIVDPAYQRRGIGRSLMEKVIERFGETAIYAEAVAGVEGFFASCGLSRRPGMTVFSRKASRG